MKIVDSERMSSIDSRAQTEYAIPASILMENAGLKAYAICRGLMPEFSDAEGLILFVAGRGNNGGDALVMARQAFLDGLNVAVLLAGPVRSETAAVNLEIARKLNIRTVSFPDEPEEARRLLRSAATILDGLFGTGVSGRLRPDAVELVEEINKSGAQVVAIDMPSGLGDGYRRDFPVVRAAITLCLGLPKECLYLPAARTSCGRIIHVPIGFPPALTDDPNIPGELLEFDAIGRLIQPLPPDAHKGTRGKLAIFAGATGTTGAPVLASLSAARARSGLVYLFVDEDAYATVASNLVSVMARPWKWSEDPESFDFDRYDAFLAGPGWGFEGRRPWLERLIGSGLNGVLDADALTLLSDFGKIPDFKGEIILTPHPGEMARLSGSSIEEVLDDPVGSSRDVAGKYRATVVFKSHVTLVCEPEGNFWIYDGVNPALGTGGTGDVLAGIIAGLLCAGTGARDAACLGVLIHGKAAERAFEERGWFLAEDLPPYISKILAGIL